MFKTALLSSILLASPSLQASTYPWDLTDCLVQLVGNRTQATPLLQKAREQEPVILQQLMNLMAIASVSPDSSSKTEMQAAADEVVAFYQGVVGAPRVRKFTVNGSLPYVVAESEQRPGLPTILFYAHYDVMPPGPEDKWTITQPFQPRIIGTSLYGRGAGDNKGGVYVIGAALKPFLDSGNALGFNFRVILDGEEEIGSPNFIELTKQHPELFSDADMVIAPDGVNLRSEVPTITTSLRGLLKVSVTVTAGEKGVHSGIYGNAYPDPRTAVTMATAKLFDSDNGTITIPSLYQGLIPVSASEQESLRRLQNREQAFRANAGLLEHAQILSHGVFPIDAQLARETSIAILGIDGTNGQTATIPPFAQAHLSVRVPPGKDPQAVRRALVEHYRKNTPFNLQVDVSEDPGATYPWHADADHPALNLVGTALSFGFGTEPTLFMGSGGTIGLMTVLSRATKGAPQMLIGIDDPDTNLHGPDEQLHLRTFAGNRDGLIHLLHSLSLARRFP